MATAYQIIRRALKILRVVDASEALPAVDAADGLLALNSMLAEWHEAEIGLPEYSFSSLEDTLSTDAADSEAIAYQLAERVAPEYGKDLTPAQSKAAMESMGRLRSRYFQPGQVSFADMPQSTWDVASYTDIANGN